MNCIKCICFLLVSLLSNIAKPNTLSWYGILRGNAIIDYKSPVNGIVDYINCTPGKDENNSEIFRVTSVDDISKKEILNLKRDRARDEYKRYKNEYVNANNAFREGLVAKKELIDIGNKMNGAVINLKEVEREIETLNYINKLSNPYIKGKFVCQDVFVSQGSYVNAGDLLMKIEMINKYRLEIKYDPVTTNLKNNSIRYRSLVNSSTGNAKLIATKNLTDNSSMGGLKSAIIELENNGELSPELLDTAFEITLYD
ncbi:ABC transporter (plasmid) [Escherichia coli]